jgi:hypothetical protein
MTNTNSTIPSDTSAKPRTNRRHRARLALLLAGLGMTGLAACGSATPVETQEPAAAVERSVRPAMSPDALERWDTSASSGAVVSADAAEHAAVSEAERQAAIDQASCERLSQGQAPC